MWIAYECKRFIKYYDYQKGNGFIINYIYKSILVLFYKYKDVYCKDMHISFNSRG